jgi:hypothetical protein
MYRSAADQIPSSSQGASRRQILAGAAVAAGGLGITALIHPEVASAVEQFEGYLNVKDFGTFGTPSDTRQAIQACIDQASADKKVVYFPPGTYTIDSGASSTGLTLKQDSHLVGHGTASVIKVDDSASPFNVLLSPADDVNETVSNIRIEDLTFDANSRVKFYVIRVHTKHATNLVNNVALLRVQVMNHLLQTSDQEADNSSYAVFLNKIKNASVEDCYFHDGQRDGLHVRASENVVLTGNVISGYGDDHITVGISKRCSIVGNVVLADRTNRGMAIIGGPDSTIVGNVCVGGLQGGVGVRGGATNVVFANNLILRAGTTSQDRGPFSTPGLPRGSGIVLLSQTSPLQTIKIQNNIIDSPKNHGVVIVANSAEVSDVEICGNTIRALQPPTSSTGYKPSGVALIGSVQAGTLVDLPANKTAKNVRIGENVISDFPGPGISVRGQNNDAIRPIRFDIQGNRILDSGNGGPTPLPAGILVEQVKGFLVSGNRAQDTRSSGSKTQQSGLEVVGASGSNNLVVGNDFSENVNAGINPASPSGVTVASGTNLV